jgi:hypothetical protein
VKRMSGTGPFVVFLLTGAMIPAHAQDKDTPPALHQSQPQRTRQQALQWQQERGWLREGGGWPEHKTWQQSRAHRWYSDHRTWTQRGGYGGSYIPQTDFSLRFGSKHSFRLPARPVMYLGYPRFEYGGYSFLLVDPWPEYWPDNWHEVEDVYIDYDDGYYLKNARYPQVRIAISVAL